MRYGKINILVLGLWMVSGGIAFAAELQVIVVGHGFVHGEHFGCGDNCKKAYAAGTVVQLKAIPFPDARFVEWKIDGQSYRGIITIEKDTVVSAIFELKDEPSSDDLRVSLVHRDGGESFCTHYLR